MRIGIIGSGNVGGTLGSRWASEGGHQVVFSSRNPGSAEMRALVAKAGANASAGSVVEAVADAEVVLIATPWPGTRAAIESAGALTGKIVIDATNPLLPDLSGLEVGTNSSGGELVASWAGAGARVVKAFNTIGYGIMADPHFEGGDAVMFYCGDDAPAKAVVHRLAAELGFDAQDAGPLARARLLEPFALLWISLALKRGVGMGFRYMRRS
jgi:8-hydroxy-5-deazaflavin:NADPH oxidoreductase